VLRNTQSGSALKQRNHVKRKRLPILLAFALVAIAGIACLNDLTPQGGWSGPVAEDGSLYIGNRDGRLVKFDPATGNLDHNWRYPFEDGLGAIYGNAVVIGENMYSTGYTCRGDECNGEIFGVNIADGRPIWGQRGIELETKLVGDIGVFDSTLLVGTTVIGDEEDSADGYLYALDSDPNASPIVKWRIPLDGNALSGVVVDGSTAYIATMAGTVYAVDVAGSEVTDASSRIKWTFEAEGAIAGPIHAEEGSIYFGDFANNAYRLNTRSRPVVSRASELNPTNGEWKFNAGAWVWAKPLIENGVVYVAALDGSIFAVDSSTGNEKWSASIEGQIVSAPALFDRKRGETRERALAVPSGEKNVWVISVIDGRELGVFVTDEKVKSTPLVHGDNLYVHTLNGDLQWFSVDDTTLRGCVDLKGGGRCD
jgi:outer membrane protein assembly factor BamB